MSEEEGCYCDWVKGPCTYCIGRRFAYKSQRARQAKGKIYIERQHDKLMLSLKEEFKINEKVRQLSRDYTILFANVGCDPYIIRKLHHLLKSQMRTLAIKSIQDDEERLANVPIDSLLMIHLPDH